MNMMKYKGYLARIEYDEEDRIFAVIWPVFRILSVFTA
jgi:hypothetical protein